MKIILGLLSIFMIASCRNSDINKNTAVITGVSKNIKQFEVVLYNRPPEINENTYTINVDSNSSFSLVIPVKNLRFGFILIKGQRYDFCLLPGDDIHIEISDNIIKFTGRGADKNEFLYAAKEKGLSNGSYYDELNRAEISPNKFPQVVDSFRVSQLEFLSFYQDKEKLEPVFIEYYKILNQLDYERQVIMYPDYYTRRNKLSLDSIIELPKEYYQLCNFSSIVNDSKIVSREYIALINELISIKTMISLSDNSTIDEWVSANHQVMFDSLSGKTQEYILADWICSLLEEDYNDTIAIEKFKSLKPDSSSHNIVIQTINFYNKKPNLIGKTLTSEFANSILIDSGNKEILFGELLSSMKGRVVYLDIWASWCSPCKKEMIYSKKLKEKLKTEDIEFVYISAEKTDSKNWERLYKISLASRNQYVFKNGFDSKMLNFMNIKGVPHYMIFDKEGRLIDYNAERPSDNNIEKKLVKLLTNE